MKNIFLILGLLLWTGCQSITLKPEKKVKKYNPCPNFNHSYYDECREINDYKKYANKRHYIVEKNGTKALLENKGKKVLDLLYQSITVGWQQEYFVVSKNNKFALFNDKGKQLTPFEYDEMKFKQAPYLIVKKDKYFGLIKNNGEKVFETIYDFISMKTIMLKGKTALLDDNLKVITPFKYDFKHMHNIYKSNYKMVSKERGWYALMNPHGIVSNNYTIPSPLSYFTDGLFKMEKTIYLPDRLDGKPAMMHGHTEYGLVDTNGKVIASLDDKHKVLKIIDWIEGKAVYLSGNPDIIYDTNGKKLMESKKGIQVEPKVYYMHDKTPYLRAKIWTENKEGILNLKGEELVPVKYRVVEHRDGYFFVKTITSDSNTIMMQGVYNSKGKIILEPIYKNISLDNGVFHITKIDGTQARIKVNKEILVPFKYKYICGSLSPKGYVIASNSKSCITDNTLILYDTVNKRWIDHRLKDKVDEVRGFNKNKNAFIRVIKNNKVGIIREDFTMMFPCKYDAIQLSIDHKYFYLRENPDSKVINLDFNGRRVEPLKYKRINRHILGYKMIKKDKKYYGVYKNNGKLIIEPKYKHVDYMGYGLFRVGTEERKWGIINGDGKIVVPLNAFFIKYNKKNRTYHINLDGKDSEKNSIWKDFDSLK